VNDFTTSFSEDADDILGAPAQVTSTSSWRWLPDYKYENRLDPLSSAVRSQYQIKGWGKAVKSSKPLAMSSMKPVIEEARLDGEATRLGTVFNSGVDLSEKKLGIGVMNGLIGGSGFSYGIQLATYSVYHRYLRYRHHRHPLEQNETYYATFYSQNSCYQGCPPLSHCEWGICECNAGHEKELGLCWDPSTTNGSSPSGSSPQPTSVITQATESLEIEEGRRCLEARDCNNIDINLICVELVDGTKECQCRKDMQWNREALECQFFIGVDCSRLSYKDSPSPNIATAVLQHEQTIRGWTTEEDKRLKIFNLPKIQEMMNQTCALYFNYHNQTVTDYFDDKYEKRESMCPPTHFASGNSRERRFYSKFNERCKVFELLADEFAVNVSSVPTERTQTPEEALELSIWSPHNTFNISILSEAELDEAFCRDIESFSPAFTPRVTPQTLQRNSTMVPDLRPQNCPEIAPTVCAMLFDSASCSPSGWSLEIVSGTQKQMRFLTSDWKYRNDADVVGVRRGCTFTGWTLVGFGGEAFDLTAKETERWLVFEKDPNFAWFHENIESFQCNCWKD